MSSENLLVNPFWEFSLALYAQPNVADICLTLQDNHSININMLLFGCWLDNQGQPAKKTFMESAELAICDWQAVSVKPIRQLRRQLKPQLDNRYPGLYQRLKDIELESERIEQDLLFACFQETFGDYPVEGKSNLLNYLKQFDSQLVDIVEPIVLTSTRIP